MTDLAHWHVDPFPVVVEPTPRWVRVRAGDRVVADSRRALLLSWYGPGMLPTYCLPAADVASDLLVPAADPGPGLGGVTVPHDVRAGRTTLAGVAHLFRDPPPPLAALDGHWTFAWEAGLRWYEEALEVRVHARDPHKRVDVVPSERHVQVAVGGTVVADSRRPHALFETGLPTRWYVPRVDVRMALLARSGTVTHCPYKGETVHFSARAGGDEVADVAWSYPTPLPESERIAGLVAFYPDRVTVTVDGERQA